MTRAAEYGRYLKYYHSSALHVISLCAYEKLFSEFYILKFELGTQLWIIPVHKKNVLANAATLNLLVNRILRLDIYSETVGCAERESCFL